jgi:hypothetical protein
MNKLLFVSVLFVSIITHAQQTANNATTAGYTIADRSKTDSIRIDKNKIY